MRVRFLFSVAGLAAGLTLTACGGQAPPASGTTPASGAAPASAPAASPAGALPEEDAPSEAGIAAALKPWKGDLDGMVERRFIRVLVTFSKTNYFVNKAEQHGATYEAGKLFEKFLNDRLKTKNIKVNLVFVAVSRDRLFPALAEGRGDIAAAGLALTASREKLADFASPFATGVRSLVVTASGQPPVATPEDLSGRQVHVRKSSAAYENLVALNARLKTAGRPPVEIAEASEALEDEDILEMVNTGMMPATVVDQHIADFWSQIFTDMKVQPAALRTDARIGWALRKGTPELRKMVDAFVAANPPGSLNYNLVMRRYFKSTTFVKNATTEAEQKKFREVVAFFRKYGDKYDLPWLLVAAQAYQESTIDQSKKSHVGAVGVMQIKPSTAAGAPISITGVETSADRNIEAGVKYLRFMVDRYYKDAPMTQVNKGLFAVASYNAGPARVAGLRRKAQAQGLDPNVWFGNVEVVAAREIGSETVQYVSNIYKYYVAYTLLQQQADARKGAKAR
jgi:membrane-bound lytic murein transglycosylase MltF